MTLLPLVQPRGFDQRDRPAYPGAGQQHFARPRQSPASDQQRTTVQIAGGNPALVPEEATTYSLGADFKPRFLPGFVANMTYFNIDYRNTIGIAPINNPDLFFTDPSFAPFYIINPTLAQLRERIPTTCIEGAASLESLYENGRSPYTFRDACRRNLGRTKLDLDFNVNYTMQTSFGQINASWAGTYTFNRTQQASPTAVPVNVLENDTRDLTFVAALGAKIGIFTARGNYNYTGGYPILGQLPQTKVGSFETFDLFFSLDFPADRGVLGGTSLSMNVENLFNTDPPFSNIAAGFVNGSTFGWLISFSLRKRF